MICDILRAGEWEEIDGLLVSGRATDSAFTDEMQDNLLQVEDGSWWFEYRAKVIITLAKMFFERDAMTIDIGGGNGYTTSVLMKNGFRVGLVEPNIHACKNARRRGIDTVCCGIVSDETISDGSVDQCMLLDVLEHIQDDEAFLRLIHKKQKSGGGRLLLTVPAHDYLWSSEDDYAGHWRRYSKRALEAVLVKAGYQIEYVSYFFCFLILPIFILRVMFEKLHIIHRREERSAEERRELEQKQFKKRNGLVEKALRFCEKVEYNRIKAKKEMWFGTSLICVARKV